MAPANTLVLPPEVATLRVRTSSCQQPEPLSSSPLPSPSQLVNGLATRSKYFGPLATEEIPKKNSKKHEASIPGYHWMTDIDSSTSKETRPAKTASREERRQFRRPQDILQLEESLEQANAKSGDHPANFTSVNDPCEHSKIALVKGEADVLPIKKTRKKKTSSESSERQTKIKTPKVRKPRPYNEGKGDAVTKSGHKVGSKTKSAEALLSEAVAKRKKLAVLPAEEQGLQLDKAVPRKRSWSPVPNAGLAQDKEYSETAQTNCGTSTDSLFKFKSIVGDLQGSYGFAAPEEIRVPNASKTVIERSFLQSKKSKVDLVNGIQGAAISSTKVQRNPSPRKKPRTLTEKAIEPFAPVTTDMNTLSAYFEKDAIKDASTCIEVDDQKEKRKRKPSKEKCHASEKKAVIVLSPESAMKATREQTFVFGTSSQLIREDSPTTIEHLQRAMKESEIDTGLEDAADTLTAPSIFSSTKWLGMSPSKRLWSVAATNLDETQASKVEDSAKQLGDQEEPGSDIFRSSSATNGPKVGETSPVHLERHVLDDTLSPQPGLFDKDPKKIMRPLEDVTIWQGASEGDVAENLEVANAVEERRNQHDATLLSKIELRTEVVEGMPNYKGYTEFEMKREIESYGLKPIRSRTKMIECLEKCWESKQRLVRQAKETASDGKKAQDSSISQAILPSAAPTVPPTSKAASSKTQVKKRGRPKKVDPNVPATGEINDGLEVTPSTNLKASKPKAKRKAGVVKKTQTSASVANMKEDDEIYDSSPPTPSPPRRRTGKLTKGKKGQTPTPLTLSPSSSQLTNAAKPAVVRPKSPLTVLSPSTAAAASPPPPSAAATQFSLQTRLNNSITTAITNPAQAPTTTTSIQTITWYEKILLYDPIVIEDLTAWLNKEGLASVGEELEVDVESVKAWCESNGVCCLWRHGAGGKVGGRGGAGGRW